MASPRRSDWILGLLSVLSAVSAVAFFVCVGIALFTDAGGLALPWICGTAGISAMIFTTMLKFVVDCRDREKAARPLLAFRDGTGSTESQRCDF